MALSATYQRIAQIANPGLRLAASSARCEHKTSQAVKGVLKKQGMQFSSHSMRNINTSKVTDANLNQYFDAVVNSSGTLKLLRNVARVTNTIGFLLLVVTTPVYMSEMKISPPKYGSDGKLVIQPAADEEAR